MTHKACESVQDTPGLNRCLYLSSILKISFHIPAVSLCQSCRSIHTATSSLHGRDYIGVVQKQNYRTSEGKNDVCAVQVSAGPSIGCQNSRHSLVNTDPRILFAPLAIEKSTKSNAGCAESLRGVREPTADFPPSLLEPENRLSFKRLVPSNHTNNNEKGQNVLSSIFQTSENSHNPPSNYTSKQQRAIICLLLIFTSLVE